MNNNNNNGYNFDNQFTYQSGAPQMNQQQVQNQQMYNNPAMNQQYANQMSQNFQQAYDTSQQQQPMWNNQMYQQQGYQQQTFQQPNSANSINKPKKGGKLKFIIIPLVIILAIIVVMLMKKKAGGGGNAEVAPDLSKTGVTAYNNLITALNEYDPEALDNSVGVEDGDSYLAQEWAYVNGVKLREEFLKTVGSQVSVSFPEGSVMNNGEAATFTVPDFAAVTTEMETNKAVIEKLFKSSGYKPEDYPWHDEMNNLFCQYYIDTATKATKTADIALPVALAGNTPIISNDEELDKILFSTPEFHEALDKFSQICVGFTGMKDETYMEKEETHNPEYDEWYAVFKKYYDEDNGRFKKGKSKWEPWYKRDENNNLILDENGQKIVNYYSVKKEDGTDWIQPDETVFMEVEKTRQVESPWVEEDGCSYTWVGTYYIQNEYTGKNDTVFRVGDGTIDYPAGIGTSIQTKAMGSDGAWHDIRVSLIGYWTDQDAIDYSEMFDKRNRGFTTTSAIRLITFEVLVENLEANDIEIVSAMALSDNNSNLSSRTGTMYGFTENVLIHPHEKAVINDWATSTELDQKYVVWGKGFDRQFSLVYFNVLAGTGYIPEYSAYEYFTGKSSIDESIDIQNTTDNGSNAQPEETETQKEE